MRKPKKAWIQEKTGGEGKNQSSAIAVGGHSCSAGIVDAGSAYARTACMKTSGG